MYKICILVFLFFSCKSLEIDLKLREICNLKCNEGSHNIILDKLNSILLSIDDKEKRKQRLLSKMNKICKQSKSSKPKISFIIPCFNRELTIKEAIDSIYLQKIDIPFEVVCVDDCSTDNSYFSLKSYEKKYDNFILLKNKKNRGAPYSRNKAICYSNADLIFNLDSDDILPLNFFMPLYNYFVNNKCEVLYPREAHFFEDNNLKNVQRWSIKYKKFDIKNILNEDNLPAASICKFFSKRSWIQVGGLVEDLGHDAWGFSFLQLSQGFKFDIAPFGFYYHRIWSNQENDWWKNYKNKTLHLNPINSLRSNSELFTEESNNFIKKYSLFKDGDFFDYFIRGQRLKLKPWQAVESLFKAYDCEYNKHYSDAAKNYKNAISYGCNNLIVKLKYLRNLLLNKNYSSFDENLQSLIN